MPNTTTAPMREPTPAEMDKPVSLKDLTPLFDVVQDMEKKFSLLCNHLGVDIRQNYEKFQLVDYKKGLNPNAGALALMGADAMLTPQPRVNKKWYQFWK